MKKTTKTWLVTAAFLVLLGCLLFVGLMTMIKWNFMKLATVNYETNTYEINEEFDNISIATDVADIVFEISDEGKCKVECHDEENLKHSVIVEDGTLTIESIDKRSDYGLIAYVGINFDSPKIRVYLPKSEYKTLSICESTGDIKIPETFLFNDVDISLSTGDVEFSASASNTLKIKTSTGDICLESLHTGNLELSVSTGKVTVSDISCNGNITINTSTGNANLTNVQCNSLISKGNTGVISLNDVIAADKLSIERTTGSVKFKNCDGSNIVIKTGTGDVNGSLLTGKNFITQSNTGSISVPESSHQETCQVTTTTGDIKITVIKK